MSTNRETIGVSGAPGSFSEEAARLYASKKGYTEPHIAFLITVENVLAALERGEVSLGVFPVMNSIGGIVIEAVHAMGNHTFQVEEIFPIEIHQNLLVHKGMTAERVVCITSHDQALKQCSGYLSRMWPGVELKEYPDTAKAAEDIANGTLPEGTAAIASRAAAVLYGLDILEASIQDLKTNWTTFVAARRK